MANRSLDWLAQARRDLEQADASRGEGRHEWACFATHQAAEKAWGHVVAKLLRELPGPVALDLIDKANDLDAGYVSTRYPNGFPEGAPFEHYGELHSRNAIAHAGEIFEFVHTQMA
jgi:HEPN domain-containing protein